MTSDSDKGEYEEMVIICPKCGRISVFNKDNGDYPICPHCDVPCAPKEKDKEIKVND